MALFDTLIGDIAGRFGLGSLAGPLVREALHLVTGSPVGIGGFLDQFKSAGLASEAASWLGNPNSAALTGQQVERALGSSAIGSLASRLGIGAPAASTAVGYTLPKLIGTLTPGGTVPASLSQEILGFLNPPAPATTTTRVVETVTPRVVQPVVRMPEQVAPRAMTVIHDEPHLTRWLWPLLGALGVLGLGSYLFSSNTPAPVVTTPVIQAPPLPPPPPLPALPARLAISNDDGIIRYSGSVHDDETRNSIINSLKAVFGADKIQGDISVDLNRAAAPWMVNFRSAISNLKVPGIQALFDGNSVNLGGIINDADRDRISSSIRNVLGGGIVFGTLADKIGELVSGENTRVLSALTSLRTGFSATDLIGALNQSIVNFGTNSSDVPAGASGLLQNAAARIKQLAPGTVLEIAGYTDNTGDAAANVTLSQARADAIRNALIRYGVDPSMLVAKGYGSANPVASNDLLEGRFRNRRIEYHVIHS